MSSIQQKIRYFKNNITPHSRSYIYLGTGLIITGLIFLQVSSNISVSYSAYMGFEYKFEWDSTLASYNYLQIGTIPQGLVGLQLDMPVRFTEKTNHSFVLHVFLLPEKGDVLYHYTGVFPDLIPELRKDLTPEILSSHAVFEDILSFDVQGTQETTISMKFPSDNAYNVVFLADSASIYGNLSGTLIVENYYLHGHDQGGVLIGVTLLGSGMLLWGVVVIYPAAVPFIQQYRQKDNEEKSSFGNLFENMKSFVKENRMSATQRQSQNFLLLLKYEFHQVIGSPFIIGFIPFVAFILLERLQEVFRAWEPSGGYRFGEFGTTTRVQGIGIYIIDLSLVLVFALLFLFREQDEDLHRVQLALPFRRTGYIMAKFFVVMILSFVLCISFVGGTFFLVPVRNPAIGFQPLWYIWAPFLAYISFTFALTSLGFCLAIILKNSRHAIFFWVGIFVIWFYASLDLQGGILPYTEHYAREPHLQETFNSHFSLLSAERIIEYFLLRPQTPTWAMNDLLYFHDTIINPLIALGFMLLVTVVCSIVAFVIFRRRDL
ncbi:MAG: ABC transporter permease subunit [Promethearchaeota archaeon]